MKQGQCAGLVRIWSRDGRAHRGMGMAIDPRHVITCAHVVNTAVGLEPDAPDKPLEKVNIGFALCGGAPATRGKVIEWHSLRAGDLAVIKLDHPIPPEVGIAIFADVREPLAKEALSVYGIPEGENIGGHALVRCMGQSTDVEIQIDGTNKQGMSAERGFSGAGIWSDTHDAFIGMLVGGYADPRRISFMKPTSFLKEKYPALPTEHRTMPSRLQRAWAAIAAAFFVLMLYFFGANKWWEGVLPPWKPQLAAFAGLHFYAFIGPLVACYLISHARNFRLHTWSARLPKLRGFEMPTGSDAAGALGVITIILIVLLPLYGQGRFLKVLHREGHVYAYVNDFGFKPGDPGVGDCLNPLSGHALCKHEQAGLYSLITPAAGKPSVFWNNRYHYGEPGYPVRTATFWPRLQPRVLIALSILTLLLNGYALWLVFRRSAVLNTKDDASTEEYPRTRV